MPRTQLQNKRWSPRDVEIAAELDVSKVVPVLIGEEFVDEHQAGVDAWATSVGAAGHAPHLASDAAPAERPYRYAAGGGSVTKSLRSARAAMIERIEVMRGSHRDQDDLFGPLPGFRLDDVVAYEFELPERFEPWPGRTRLERTFVLVDVGVSFANPCWRRAERPDGSVVEADIGGRESWYVDLVSVERDGDRYTFRDLYIDLIVPTDGRHYRMLDLDEYGDAMAGGELSLEDAVDGLRRWQRFLDRYLHTDRGPVANWSDFPPKSIRSLMELPSPFAEPVRWEG